jgi:hypothetical protein
MHDIDWNSLLPAIGLGAGFLVLVAIVVVLDIKIFGPRRRARAAVLAREAEDRVAAAKAELSAWLDGQTEKALLYELYQQGQEMTSLQGRQLAQLNRIAGAAQLWLVLTVLGLVIGCVYALLLR